MGKKLLSLLFACVIAFPLSTAVFGQEAPAKEKAAKEVRWEGTVVRSNADKSTLTVRKAGMSNAEMTIAYDSSTKWVSQFHGDKKTLAYRGSRAKPLLQTAGDSSSGSVNPKT